MKTRDSKALSVFWSNLHKCLLWWVDEHGMDKCGCNKMLCLLFLVIWKSLPWISKYLGYTFCPPALQWMLGTSKFICSSGPLSVHLSQKISLIKVLMIEHWCLARVILVILNWHHAVTLTFYWFQGQIFVAVRGPPFSKFASHLSPFFS